jgi:uncharacterized protein (TIGR01244 family)
MNITKINDDFSISPQITAENVGKIATLGFKTIINHRPDNEGGAEQPTSQEIAEAAQALGLKYYYIPVVPNAITAEQVEVLRRILVDTPTPILGFCRTGNRANTMYQQAKSSSSTKPNAIKAFFKNQCLVTKGARWLKSKLST